MCIARLKIVNHTHCYINPTDSGSNVISTDSSHAVISAVVSSIAVFILSSTLFFIIGFVSGRFSKREKSSFTDHTSEDGTSQRQSPQQSVVYEDIVVPQQQAKDLEMKENVAYGPLTLTSDC